MRGEIGAIMVNLELYRVFYTVAKRGSLTKAAEELYISQPAVSQAIKQLENQIKELSVLKASTINGMPKGNGTSSPVERFYERVEKLEEKLEKLFEEWEELHS